MTGYLLKLLEHNLNSLEREKMYIEWSLKVKNPMFVDRLFNEHFVNRGFRKLDLYREALDCIVANLILAGRLKKKLVKPNIDLFTYKQPWMTKIVFDNIFQVLNENDYCILWKGEWNKSAATAFPTHKLINNFLHIKHKKLPEFISMRNRRGKFVKPPKTPMHDRMLKDVITINNVLCNADVRFKFTNKNKNFFIEEGYEKQVKILLETNHLILMQNDYPKGEQIWFKSIYGTTLYVDVEYEFQINKESLAIWRQFCKNDYRFGGRFYSKIFSTIPKDVRKTITIDGEDTIELDYESNHIRLLYHLDGLDFDGHPYVYPKSDLKNAYKRNIHKMIAVVAINAKDRNDTIGAVMNDIRKDIEKGKYIEKAPKYGELNKYYDEFLEYHKAIAKHVSNSEGIRLQRVDSDVMNDILVELAKQNIPGLPYHDSVLVKRSNFQELNYLMTTKYYKHLKKHPSIEYPNLHKRTPISPMISINKQPKYIHSYRNKCI